MTPAMFEETRTRDADTFTLDSLLACIWSTRDGNSEFIEVARVVLYTDPKTDVTANVVAAVAVMAPAIMSDISNYIGELGFPTWGPRGRDAIVSCVEDGVERVRFIEALPNTDMHGRIEALLMQQTLAPDSITVDSALTLLQL